jgi:hypothetical protein
MKSDTPKWIYYKSRGISYKRRKIISLKGPEAEALIEVHDHDRGLIFSYGRKTVDIFDEVQVQWPRN